MGNEFAPHDLTLTWQCPECSLRLLWHVPTMGHLSSLPLSHICISPIGRFSPFVRVQQNKTPASSAVTFFQSLAHASSKRPLAVLYVNYLMFASLFRLPTDWNRLNVANMMIDPVGLYCAMWGGPVWNDRSCTSYCWLRWMSHVDLSTLASNHTIGEDRKYEESDQTKEPDVWIWVNCVNLSKVGQVAFR